MKETDKPAFPAQRNWVYDGTAGMTLRDYFAAKAMQGSIAHKGFYASRQDYLVDADKFYAMADAMMEKRLK